MPEVEEGRPNRGDAPPCDFEYVLRDHRAAAAPRHPLPHGTVDRGL